MYVCSCFGITEQQVRQHAETGACTPRQIAGACKAGTDCGSCVRKIQALLGRGACPRREALEPVVLTTAATTTTATTIATTTATNAATAATTATAMATASAPASSAAAEAA